MPRSFVMTVIGPDRPGLVEELSKSVAAHHGNWLESRMSHLAGHFAGILRVGCPEEDGKALLDSLQGINGLTVHVADELESAMQGRKLLSFDVMANDRPGIVKQVSSTIVQSGGNVEDFTSNLESAPHAGHLVFHATGEVAVAEDFDEATLVSALEALGPDFSVSVGS